MTYVVTIAILLVTAIINYFMIIAVTKTKGENKNRIKDFLKFFKSSFKEQKWYLKKEFILSIVFAVITAIGVFGCLASIKDWPAIVRYTVILIFMSHVALIDCYTKKIFNKTIVAILVFRILFFIPEFFYYKNEFKQLIIASLAGLIIVFIILVIISFIARGGLGMGDVKVMSMLGFYTGITMALYSMTIGVFCCFFYCIYLISVKKADKKYEIPFGPFILIGLVLSIFIR